jgi:hypothetical protein
MKTKKNYVVLLAVFAVGMTLGITDATGDQRSAGKPAGKGLKRFSVCGVYGGALSGSVLIGEYTVEIPRSARIARVGGGTLQPGAVVPRSGLLVTGVIKKKKFIATSVLVSDPESSADFSETTLPNVEADPKRAR